MLPLNVSPAILDPETEQDCGDPEFTPEAMIRQTF